MCPAPPAGHDPALRAGLLETPGASARQLSPGTGVPAQGEEAGLLPGPGALPIRRLLDPPAPDELSAALLGPSHGHQRGLVHRQVAQGDGLLMHIYCVNVIVCYDYLLLLSRIPSARPKLRT